MSFLPPRQTIQPHVCNKPPRNMAEMTRWKCDDCGKIYCLEWIRDRGVSELNWQEER